MKHLLGECKQNNCMESEHLRIEKGGWPDILVSCARFAITQPFLNG